MDSAPAASAAAVEKHPFTDRSSSRPWLDSDHRAAPDAVPLPPQACASVSARAPLKSLSASMADCGRLRPSMLLRLCCLLR